MRYVTVKGTNYECGLQIGGKFGREIAARLKLLGISNKQVQRFKTRLKHIHSICNKKYPQYVRELEGFSQGSGIDYWRLLLLNCYEFRREARCSNIAIHDRKQTILAHNEDANNYEQKKHCALIKFVQKHTTFHSFVYLGELPGSAYNWNTAGLYSAINYVKPIKVSFNRVPRSFVARAVLEAKTVQEAISIMRKSNDASGFHYFIGKKNQLFSIEQCQDRLSVIKVNSTHVHTNHYIHPKFAKQASADRGSKQRLNRMRELLGKAPLRILFDKKNRPTPIYSRAHDASRTLSTIMFLPLERKVFIYKRDSLNDYQKFRL